MGYLHILQPTSKEENTFKDTPIQIVFKPYKYYLTPDERVGQYAQ
jgi:hypothetical protein